MLESLENDILEPVPFAPRRGRKGWFVGLFADLLVVVESTGTYRELVADCRAALKRYRQQRSAAGKAAKGRSGRKGVELPWDDIDRLRRRRKSWRDISERLEAAGTRISPSGLRDRYVRRRKRVTIVKTRLSQDAA